MEKEIKTENTVPVQKTIFFADMHTHSENSHDSCCKIEDMVKAQIKRGSVFFAVTDHFDTDLYGKTDIFTPIKNAAAECRRLNKIYGKECTALCGVELGEGFWNNDAYRRIIEQESYDVVLGSIHQVRFENMTEAYAQIDFSLLPEERIYAYLDTYFDDLLTLLENTDFDVLCHLTCPLRYINGKYSRGIDISPFESKIENILKKVIEKGVSLEINTSSADLISDYMPPRSIIEKYYNMGGCMVTLGSDAHRAQDAAKGFEQAVCFLKQTGFEHIYYYKDRKPCKIKI